MPTKPNPLLGLLIGIVAAWVATTLVNYASIKLNFQRTTRFDNSLVHGLPWVLLILVVSLLAGFVLSIRARVRPATSCGTAQWSSSAPSCWF